VKTYALKRLPDSIIYFVVSTTHPTQPMVVKAYFPAHDVDLVGPPPAMLDREEGVKLRSVTGDEFRGVQFPSLKVRPWPEDGRKRALVLECDPVPKPSAKGRYRWFKGEWVMAPAPTKRSPPRTIDRA
jgi:hypothetical protein